MIQKQFTQIAEILTISWICESIYLKNRNFPFFVNLVAWRVCQWTFTFMSFQFVNRTIETEAIFTDEQCLDVVIARRVRAIVPRIAFILPDLNLTDSLQFCSFFMHSQSVLIHAFMLIILIKFTGSWLYHFFGFLLLFKLRFVLYYSFS